MMHVALITWQYMHHRLIGQESIGSESTQNPSEIKLPKTYAVNCNIYSTLANRSEVDYSIQSFKMIHLYGLASVWIYYLDYLWQK